MCQTLLDEINAFEADAQAMNPSDVERKFSDILSELLSPDGFEVRHVGGLGDGGVDIIATKDADSILVQVKHRRTDMLESVSAIREFVGTLFLHSASRGIFFSTGKGFSRSAWEVTKHEMAPDIDLLDFAALRGWVSRLERATEEDHSPIETAVTEFSQKLAALVAETPDFLDEVEWRDMERMLAVVFDGLGFSVELTPPAKDGGRDLILECRVQGHHKTYLVEVKHWTCRNRVGGKHLRHFVDVVACEDSDGGLFLATYGFAGNAFESLTEVDRISVRLSLIHI